MKSLKATVPLPRIKKPRARSDTSPEIVAGNLFERNKNSTEGVIAPAGAKVTGATIRTWLLNKFISFLAVLTWKTGLKKM